MDKASAYTTQSLPFRARRFPSAWPPTPTRSATGTPRDTFSATVRRATLTRFPGSSFSSSFSSSILARDSRPAHSCVMSQGASQLSNGTLRARLQPSHRRPGGAHGVHRDMPPRLRLLLALPRPPFDGRSVRVSITVSPRARAPAHPRTRRHQLCCLAFPCKRR